MFEEWELGYAASLAWIFFSAGAAGDCRFVPHVAPLGLLSRPGRRVMPVFRGLKRLLTPRTYVQLKRWEFLGTAVLNLLVFSFIFVYLFPTLYMLSASFMETAQLRDRNAPPYPARQVRYDYDGKERLVYQVPFGDELRELALVNPGRTSSEFIDPTNPAAGLITWDGSWRTLVGVYRFPRHAGQLCHHFRVAADWRDGTGIRP
jgi:hypothetical protein